MMVSTCSQDNPCTAVQLIQDQIKNDKEANKVRMDRQDAILDKLMTRLPLWATMLIATLTAACGFLAK